MTFKGKVKAFMGQVWCIGAKAGQHLLEEQEPKRRKRRRKKK